MSKTDREQKVTEVRTYNQASETIHAGLGRISSRIRLSLSRPMNHAGALNGVEMR